MTDPFTDTRMWCPRCGRVVANHADGWTGTCPVHGVVPGEFVAPLVVVDDDGVQGLFVSRSNTGMSTVTRTGDGVDVHLLAANATVARADNVGTEDWR